VSCSLLCEHHGQEHQAVTERARDGHGMQAAELVGHQVVPRDATADAEIRGMGSGMDRADRHDEPQAIGRGDLTTTSRLRQWHAVWRRDERGIGGDQGFIADVVLFDPEQPIASEGWHIVAYQRFGIGVAGLSPQDRAQAGR
jgi:hypothetical protein